MLSFVVASLLFDHSLPFLNDVENERSRFMISLQSVEMVTKASFIHHVNDSKYVDSWDIDGSHSLGSSLLEIFPSNESLRWLLITDRKEEAKDVIIKAAKKEIEATVWMDLPKVTVGFRKLVWFAACVVTQYFQTLFFVGKVIAALTTGTVYLHTPLNCSRPIQVTRCMFYAPLLEDLKLFSYRKRLCWQVFITYLLHEMFTFAVSIPGPPQTTDIIPNIRYWKGFPSLIIGGLSLTTPLMVMIMPDTVEDLLPDTVQQAETLGTKRLNDIKIVMDLETVLRELKIFGRYHLKLIFLLGMLAFGSMWHSTNYIFAVENYGYRCKHPNCGYTDLVNLELNSSFDFKCHKYKVYDDNGACVADNFNPQNPVECSEWVYERPDSFVAEFNLGCESWKRTLVGTMHSVGYMIGLFLVGPLSDKYGRKIVVIFTAVACAAIGLAKSVVYSYWLYVSLELMEPLLGDCYSATFTLAIESVTKEHRPIIIFLLSLFTTCGAARRKKRTNLIRKAAKMNNIVIDETKLSNLKCEENSANVSLTTLVKITVSSKNLLLRLICCICMWFTALFNAYSLLINSVSLEGNKYLNFELVALTGFPASVIILFLLMKCTRKRPLIFSFLLTGTFCTAHSILPKGYGWLSILLYVSGKLCSSVSIRIVYIYTSELFPTYTRNTMHALCSALGRIAAIVAPQTPLLLDYWEGLPSLIIGVLSVLTACLITLLPDTSDDVLPDNVCQAEAVGKKEKNICKLEKTEIGIDICSKL
ncbi:hypothetical protein HW555_009126 [Spodoptera exigua]|uniref:Organic cation transporter n=1 Tax=Spodoptera exigua TaxID=7107 RepID=A0A835G9H5_SPOEX|nr:hypothetical protein HW555_009126 [Spodoptera exigua]